MTKWHPKGSRWWLISVSAVLGEASLRGSPPSFQMGQLSLYCEKWRGRLVAYGACLESRFTFIGIAGSNPALSAKGRKPIV